MQTQPKPDPKSQSKQDAEAKAAGAPSWWRDDPHGAAWERAKPSVSRSWGQARPPPTPTAQPLMGKDLGGELENASHGRGQSSGTGQGPGTQSASLEGESSLRFGVGARQQYGAQHPAWSPDLESKLKADWEVYSGQASDNTLRKDWNEAKYGVRHGYEYNAEEPK